MDNLAQNDGNLSPDLGAAPSRGSSPPLQGGGQGDGHGGSSALIVAVVSAVCVALVVGVAMTGYFWKNLGKQKSRKVTRREEETGPSGRDNRHRRRVDDPVRSGPDVPMSHVFVQGRYDPDAGEEAPSEAKDQDPGDGAAAAKAEPPVEAGAVAATPTPTGTPKPEDLSGVARMPDTTSGAGPFQVRKSALPVKEAAGLAEGKNRSSVRKSMASFRNPGAKGEYQGSVMKVSAKSVEDEKRRMQAKRRSIDVKRRNIEDEKEEQPEQEFEYNQSNRQMWDEVLTRLCLLNNDFERKSKYTSGVHFGFDRRDRRLHEVYEEEMN